MLEERRIALVTSPPSEGNAPLPRRPLPFIYTQGRADGVMLWFVPCPFLPRDYAPELLIGTAPQVGPAQSPGTARAPPHLPSPLGHSLTPTDLYSWVRMA